MIDAVLSNGIESNVPVHTVHRTIHRRSECRTRRSISLSSLSLSRSFRSSLPIIVSVSPDKAPTRHLSPPAILRRAHPTFHSSLSSLQNIHTTFFKDLIQQHGTNTVSSVTQCVLDLALIVSVHTALPSLQTSLNDANDDYRRRYQQIIDPLKYTSNESENTKPIVSNSAAPDILEFYGSIKKNKANIRNAQSRFASCLDGRYSTFFLVMRHLIVGLAPRTVKPLSNVSCDSILDSGGRSNFVDDHQSHTDHDVDSTEARRSSNASSSAVRQSFGQTEPPSNRDFFLSRAHQCDETASAFHADHRAETHPQQPDKSDRRAKEGASDEEDHQDHLDEHLSEGFATTEHDCA